MTRTGYLGDLLSQLAERRFVPLRAVSDKPLREMCAALIAGEGEVSTMRLAGDILASYARLDETGKRAFFALLAEEYDITPEAVTQAALRYGEDRDANTLRWLLEAAEPKRQSLLRRLNHAPGATGELVRMRRDLLRLLPEMPELARVDLDFAHLFQSWFNRGFLVLKQVTWESPARLLEKIIEYEAVHAIGDWEALRARVDPKDRRCFAFLHPAMPDEPLIFVEVALTKGIPNSVQNLLAPDRTCLDAAQTDTATFYSISNCQVGLKGISFGNSLIKQVVALLQQEFPHLRNFVTLSPIPGLVAWMRELAEQGDSAAQSCLEADHSADKAAAQSLRAFGARYLLEAKDNKGRPRDPVARFHLHNGALVHEIHAQADTSARGLRQSCGAMVNYLYDLEQVEANHESYAAQHKIASTRSMRQLARVKPD
ncbi:malonyl-CoA decarboxylase domain-containing protein [Roseinatronobacter bogoriensis]|uniref:Decarboxylase n=1 Tax=Roseinatronobacter bogoriensis subsp. barguzinensis TaxID=441209 RepID=A0A2K8KG52_9RHOB|nr:MULTISPECIES: malonyl-CoA decarboxylase family protein [Rhodobaca]ATX66963.1 decarboxylase [Rhodobaca barguzinensis]MBB4206455.1 malonyl-CoA decarboxylase [Rhodobaca bogoriensis DSM 18756]